MRVQVLSADPKAKRIALSMKALDTAPAPPKLRHTAKVEAKEPTIAEQLSGLSNKFQVR